MIFTLSPIEWFGLIASAVLIGMGKTGVHGAAMITVPTLALLFGAKASTGIALGLLVVADVLAVLYYHRHADWTVLWRLFPATAVGVALGTALGQWVSDEWFRLCMVIFILLSIAMMIIQEIKQSLWVPQHQIFAVSAGTLGGVATMVGNMAGPLMTVYLLSQRLPKQVYIGTAAWFFLIVNVFKLPFHAFVWETLSVNTLALTAAAIPAIVAGAWMGIQIVKRIGDTRYRWFVIATTSVSAIVLLV